MAQTEAEPVPASGETPSVRVALGVDLQRAYVPAAALLEAMRFPGGHVTLIHVASEHPPIAVEHGVEGLDQRYFDETERLGRAALEEAGAILSAMGLTVECRIVRDLAARGLVTTSEAEEIDVVAVNAERKPVIGVNAVGSVTAGITSAPRICLLIAKGERQNRGFLRAVLATDHSPCANACLDRFLALAPKGITEILVLCPWEIEEDDAERVARDLAVNRADAERWIEESIQRLNDQVCKRLEEKGYRTRSRVVKGGANEAIDRAVSDVEADLLILGPVSGEANLQALMISGSLSHALGTPYPVLLIHPKDA